MCNVLQNISLQYFKDMYSLQFLDIKEDIYKFHVYNLWNYIK